MERRRSQDGEESARRYTSPAVGTGTRPRITGKGVVAMAAVGAVSGAGSGVTRPYSGSPPRGRRSGKGISRGQVAPGLGPQGTRDVPYSARRQPLKTARSDAEKNQSLVQISVLVIYLVILVRMAVAYQLTLKFGLAFIALRIREVIKAQLPENKTRILFNSGHGTHGTHGTHAQAPRGLGSTPTPDGLQELKRLLASSPSPPRWAETSIVEETACPGRGPRTSEPLGKWARGSLVGAQVRSASDLHRVGPRDLLDEEPPPRCASEGAQISRRGHLKRRLFCRCGCCGLKLPLPPKPLFPPPGADSLLEISAVSSSSSAVFMTSDRGEERPLFSLPTPCRSTRQDKSHRQKPKVDIQELVDSVVTLKTRLTSIQALPPGEAQDLLAPLQKFEALLRSQMKDSHEM